MKKIFIVTVSILTLLGCKKEQIETANPDTIEGIELTILQPDKHYNLRAIHFIDNQTGFASSYDGKIIKTTDAGSTWDELETNTTVPLYGIDFINSTIVENPVKVNHPFRVKVSRVKQMIKIDSI
jgi:hypothetical protein